MTKVNRRNALQGALAALAAGTLARPAGQASTGLRRPLSNKPARIKLALIQDPHPNSRFKLARQMGVNHAIVTVASELSKVRREQYLEKLVRIQADFTAAGLTIAGVESYPVAAEKIKLGLPGRDEEIQNYCAALEALGRLGIPMVCYNFMAGLGWYRTNVAVPARGGALATEFNLRDAEKQGPTEWGVVSEEKIWQNLEYFLKAVIPVAEKAKVKMALHPDDPPVSPLRGIGRILTSAANYRRVLNLVPSPVNGITFCQANFKLMGKTSKPWRANGAPRRRFSSYTSAMWMGLANISSRPSTTTGRRIWPACSRPTMRAGSTALCARTTLPPWKASPMKTPGTRS